ncbi:MAG: hypothetical protein M0Z63_12635 [Actinomycetota bacterium]|nr:hypothetical protein [Actinomycetota bacterium]
MLVPGPGASGPEAVAASSPLDTAATSSVSHPSTLDLVRHAASAGSTTVRHVVMVPMEVIAHDLGTRLLRPGGPGVEPVEQFPGHPHPHLR